MSLSTPQQVQERLDQIDTEVAERQNDYERAAGDKARYTRDWDKRYAIAMLKAKGPSAEVRKAAALVMAAEQDDLYDKLTEAEATYAAAHAALRSRDTRVGIGQSILKAQGRA